MECLIRVRGLLRVLVCVCVCVVYGLCASTLPAPPHPSAPIIGRLSSYIYIHRLYTAPLDRCRHATTHHIFERKHCSVVHKTKTTKDIYIFTLLPAHTHSKCVSIYLCLCLCYIALSSFNTRSTTRAISSALLWRFAAAAPPKLHISRARRESKKTEEALCVWVQYMLCVCVCGVCLVCWGWARRWSWALWGGLAATKVMPHNTHTLWKKNKQKNRMNAWGGTTVEGTLCTGIYRVWPSRSCDTLKSAREKLIQWQNLDWNRRF